MHMQRVYDRLYRNNADSLIKIACCTAYILQIYQHAWNIATIIFSYIYIKQQNKVQRNVNSLMSVSTLWDAYFKICI